MTSNFQEWRGMAFKIVKEDSRYRAVIYIEQPVSTTAPTPDRNHALTDARSAIDAIITQGMRAELKGMLLDIFKNEREIIRELLGIP